MLKLILIITRINFILVLDLKSSLKKRPEKSISS